MWIFINRYRPDANIKCHSFFFYFFIFFCSHFAFIILISVSCSCAVRFSFIVDEFTFWLAFLSSEIILNLLFASHSWVISLKTMVFSRTHSTIWHEKKRNGSVFLTRDYYVLFCFCIYCTDHEVFRRLLDNSITLCNVSYNETLSHTEWSPELLFNAHIIAHYWRVDLLNPRHTHECMRCCSFPVKKYMRWRTLLSLVEDFNADRLERPVAIRTVSFDTLWVACRV